MSQILTPQEGSDSGPSTKGKKDSGPSPKAKKRGRSYSAEGHCQRLSGKMSRTHAQPPADDPDTDTDAIDHLMCGPSSSTASLAPADTTRDDAYYFEDGSCVLLVGSTLFNVHRSILSRDSSSFGPMFSLPQGGNEAEGRSDENPIVLSGDTADEFRHFLWALYALPPELRVATNDLTHLIDIAKLSNKYSFKSLETWALDAIQDYVNRTPSPLFPTTDPAASPTAPNVPGASQPETAAQLTRLIRLAQMCAHDRLLATMVALLRQLMAHSVQYAYLAMKLADELDLRALRGAAYLEVMQKATVVKRAFGDARAPTPPLALGPGGGAQAGSGAAEGTVDAAGRLVITRTQQLKLLAGYYRLTTTWDRLRMTPLQFEHSHSCGATWHQQGCTQSWLEFWKEKTRSDGVMNLGLADVLGRLKLVQKDYDRWGSATYMHHDCRMNAKKAIGDMIKRVEEALPDYFSEPGDFAEDDLKE